MLRSLGRGCRPSAIRRAAAGGTRHTPRRGPAATGQAWHAQRTPTDGVCNERRQPGPGRGEAAARRCQRSGFPLPAHRSRPRICVSFTPTSIFKDDKRKRYCATRPSGSEMLATGLVQLSTQLIISEFKSSAWMRRHTSTMQTGAFNNR